MVDPIAWSLALSSGADVEECTPDRSETRLLDCYNNNLHQRLHRHCRGFCFRPPCHVDISEAPRVRHIGRGGSSIAHNVVETTLSSFQKVFPEYGMGSVRFSCGSKEAGETRRYISFLHENNVPKERQSATITL